MVDAFFVYGTLKREQCRAKLWPASPRSVRAAWVRAHLFGRHDYPAMTPGEDRVVGELWTFRESDVALVKQTLDQIEGTNQPGQSDLYVREVVEPRDLIGRPLAKAYTYFYAVDPTIDGFARISPADENGLVDWSAET